MILKNIDFENYSSIRIKGKAAYFQEFKNLEDIKEALILSQDKKIPFFVIGSGTNVLFPDNFYSGLILKNSFQGIELRNNKVFVKSGTIFSDLLNFYLENSFTGLEWAAGLPGTVGGAIFSNAGAFGEEIKNSLVKVKSFDIKTFSIIERNKEECNFSYRNSVFKERINQEIIIESAFSFSLSDKNKIKEQILNNLEKRKKSQPLNYPNLGSIFKNPSKEISAGELIEKVGLKGVSFGRAMISKKHSNFIVNLGGAESKDILQLISLVKKEVKQKFGIKLEEEIIIM